MLRRPYRSIYEHTTVGKNLDSTSDEVRATQTVAVKGNPRSRGCGVRIKFKLCEARSRIDVICMKKPGARLLIDKKKPPLEGGGGSLDESETDGVTRSDNRSTCGK